MSAPAPLPADPVRVGPLDIVRLLLEAAAVVTLALWGFLTWPFPANIVAGIVAPMLAVLAWALFVSPRAVLAVDVYLRSVVELAIMAAAAFAWWALGAPFVALAFGVLAVVSGVLQGRAEIGRSGDGRR